MSDVEVVGNGLKSPKSETPQKMANKRKADDNDATEYSPKTPKQSKIKIVKTPQPPTPKGLQKVATPKQLPKDWDEADEADKMLFTSREKNVPWSEIRQNWKKITGEETGNSTLPNRYNRIKCNLMRLKEGHARILLEAEIAVEADMDKIKWAKITEKVNEATSESYQSAFIMKQVKDLKNKGGLAALSNLPKSSENGEVDGEVNSDPDTDGGVDVKMKDEEVDEADLP